MANIAITKYCNLNCSYCFAETLLEERETKNIEIKQFKKILAWLKQTPNERIGLIGGEPTLHPEFSKILFITQHFCNTNNREAILFTNGVYIDKYIEQIKDNMHVLININSPEAMNKNQYNKMLFNLDKLYSLKKLNFQYNIGCNIYYELKNYNFLWDIVDKYNIMHVRTSICAPTKKIDKQNKDNYFKQIKPIFLEFVKQAKKRNVSLGADCNQIPYCYYSEKELQLINSCLEKKSLICHPVIDINADFKACSCFGNYKELISCEEFKNIEELSFYFLGKINFPKMINNNEGKCKGCKEHNLLKCQGGCLSFCNGNIYR